MAKKNEDLNLTKEKNAEYSAYNAKEKNFEEEKNDCSDCPNKSIKTVIEI
jgi:hypothetical protein